MVDEAVGKEPVGEEGAIRVIDKEVAAIVIHIIDRFRIVGVLVAPHTDVGVDHVMKGLKHIAHDRRPAAAVRIFRNSSKGIVWLCSRSLILRLRCFMALSTFDMCHLLEFLFGQYLFVHRIQHPLPGDFLFPEFFLPCRG